MGVGAITVIIIFGIPVLLFVLLFAYLTIGASFGMMGTRPEDMPKRNRHQPYDYYDEPDGFYVTLPNGEVRID